MQKDSQSQVKLFSPTTLYALKLLILIDSNIAFEYFGLLKEYD